MQNYPTGVPPKHSSSSPRRTLRNTPIFLVLPALVLSCIALTSSNPTALTPLTLPVSQSSKSSLLAQSNIAFLIQTYNRSIPLVPSLLTALWHPQNVYVIHVDAKTSADDIEPLRAFIRKQNYSQNVHFMPSEPLSYMGISLLLNTVNAISFLLKLPFHWDYFINLSATDYPLVSPSHLRDILSMPALKSRNFSFIQPFGNPAKKRYPIFDSRFSTVYVDSSLWLPHTTARTFKDLTETNNCKKGCMHPIAEGLQEHPLTDWPNGKLPVIKTEAWVILHRSFAKFVADSALSRRILAILTNIFGPEEYFWGTLGSLSEEFHERIAWDAFRNVQWRYKKSESSSSPPYLDSGEIANVTDILWESGALFCRKLEKVSSPLKKFIDDKMLIEPEPSADWTSQEPYHLRRARQRVGCVAQFPQKYSEENVLKEYRVCMRPLKKDQTVRT